MGERLSVDALARRRRKAVARRLERDVPLLLATGVVRAPSQVDAVEQVRRQRAEADAWVERIEAGKRQGRRRAAWLRAFVAVRVCPDALGELDHYVARVFGAHKLKTSPELICDFWLRVLRDGGPVLAESVDAELAAELGYAQVETSLPISLASWRATRRDPAAEQRVLELCRELDERARRRAGGEQMSLGLLSQEVGG